MRKSFQYRAYPNKETEKNALKWLYILKKLYNTALEQKRMIYFQSRENISIRSHKQHKSDSPSVSDRNKELLSLGINGQIPELKAAFPEYKDINSATIITATDRLDKAYNAFYRGLTTGEGIGEPHFKSEYNSFTLRKSGWKLVDNRLNIVNVGSFKLKLHRPMSGDIKEIIVSIDNKKHWYVSFSCDNVERNERQNDKVKPDVGIDVGINTYLYDSDNRTIENPKLYRAMQSKLAEVQRQWDKIKKQPRSPKKERLRLKLSKLHEKVARQRKDFLHKISNMYVRNYATIYREDLTIKNMSKRAKKKVDPENETHFLPNGASAKSGLNKSILDASWGTFFNMIKYKAEEGGKQVIAVDPKFTSQICSGCGRIVKKTLAMREHNCECGLKIDRDYNASINVLNRGRTDLAVLEAAK